ncbi:MAG: helix-turn-helix domain-containing protein [Bacteroidota bacterium]
MSSAPLIGATPEASGAIQRLPFRHSSGRASPVEVTRLSSLRARGLDHSIYDPTRLTFHFLQFVVAGDGAHTVDFVRTPLQTGDVLHIRPEQVHAFDPASEHEALAVFFTPEAPGLSRAPAVWWPSGPLLRPSAGDADVLVGLVRLLERLDDGSAEIRPESFSPYALAAILAGLADVTAAQRHPIDITAQRYEALVSAFEQRLDRHIATSRSPAWYAPDLGTTTRTLARACREVRGRSPKQIADARAVLEAKRLLATTTDTVEAIGYALGFSEATNFVKFFRRVDGSTPEAFRRSQGAAG